MFSRNIRKISRCGRESRGGGGGHTGKSNPGGGTDLGIVCVRVLVPVHVPVPVLVHVHVRVRLHVRKLKNFPKILSRIPYKRLLSSFSTTMSLRSSLKIT